MLIHLESADDPRTADYRNLTDTQLRKRIEPREGLYIAESSKVLRRAIEAGHEPRSFFLAPKWAGDLADLLERFPQVPAYVADEQVLETITGFHLHRGALAAMNRPSELTIEEVLGKARRVAVLEDIVDHTNLERCSVLLPRSAWMRYCSAPAAQTRSTDAPSGSAWEGSSRFRGPDSAPGQPD